MCRFLRCRYVLFIGFLPRVSRWTISAVIHCSYFPAGILVLLMLFNIILYLSLLSFKPHAPTLSTSFLVRSCSSLLLPAIMSISSGKRRLQTHLPAIEIDVLGSWRVTCIILCGKISKSVGEIRHPYLTLIGVWMKHQI